MRISAIMFVARASCAFLHSELLPKRVTPALELEALINPKGPRTQIVGPFTRAIGGYIGTI